MSSPDAHQGTDGVRLLSRRPSLLYKVAHLAPDSSGDVAEDGLELSGPGWPDRLKAVLDALSVTEMDLRVAVAEVGMDAAEVRSILGKTS